MIKLKSLLQEYVTNPIISLGKYLQMDDEKKGDDLAWHISHPIRDFLIQNYPKSVIPDIDNMEDYDIVDYLYKNLRDIFDDYGIYLLGQLKSGYISKFHIDTGYPTWNYLEFRSYVKNQWLIHFSDNADDIWRDQKFKYGMDDYQNLGLTTYYKKEAKHGGYNFAYDIADYAKHGRSNFRAGTWKYGKEAVMFKASGVKAWHWGDEEPQVIFWGATAKDIVLIWPTDPGPWGVVNSKTKNPVFIGELPDVVRWVQANFDQYKNVLLP